MLFILHKVHRLCAVVWVSASNSFVSTSLSLCKRAASSLVLVIPQHQKQKQQVVFHAADMVVHESAGSYLAEDLVVAIVVKSHFVLGEYLQAYEHSSKYGGATKLGWPSMLNTVAYFLWRLDHYSSRHAHKA